MPTLDASSICIALQSSPGEICIQFPGGGRLCASVGVDIGDATEIFRNILAQANAAMMPLQPFFIIFDVLQKVYQCMTAVKKAIGPPPNPGKLVQCLVDLQKAIDELLKLHPALSIPIMIRDLLTAIITGLSGLKNDLQAMIQANARLLAAELRGAELGNLELQAAVDCGKAQLSIEFVNFNEGVKPLSRLIGLVNALLELAEIPGVRCIKIPLDPFTDLSNATTAPIDLAIQALTFVRDLISVPQLPMPPIPKSTDPC